MAERRITRKQSRRGMQVRVVTSDNRPDLVGTLTGWGSQIIEVAPAEQTPYWPWKRHSVANVSVDGVFEVDA